MEASPEQPASQQLWRPARFTPRVGGRYDMAITFLRILLPVCGVAIVLATLGYALFNKSETSFILSRSSIAASQDRLRMVNPRYSGLDNKNRPFTVTAASAVQPRGVLDEVTLSGITARMTMDNDIVVVALSDEGTYFPNDERLNLNGAVLVEASNGYRIETSDTGIDLDDQLVFSNRPVASAGPLGTFKANSFMARINEDSLGFSGNVRAVILPKGPTVPNTLEANDIFSDELAVPGAPQEPNQ